MADALRGSMDAAEYKQVRLGRLRGEHTKLDAECAQGADSEDPDEYRAANIF